MAKKGLKCSLLKKIRQGIILTTTSIPEILDEKERPLTILYKIQCSLSGVSIAQSLYINDLDIAKLITRNCRLIAAREMAPRKEPRRNKSTELITV